MKSNFFSSSSILRKFLVFNFIVFLVLGVFTFLYLNAIKPNLVKNRSDQHTKIINNTTDIINVDDTLNLLSIGRQGILDYIDQVELNVITPKIILTLDAYRSALKVTPQYAEKIIASSSRHLVNLLNVK